MPSTTSPPALEVLIIRPGVAPERCSIEADRARVVTVGSHPVCDVTVRGAPELAAALWRGGDGRLTATAFDVPRVEGALGVILVLAADQRPSPVFAVDEERETIAAYLRDQGTTPASNLAEDVRLGRHRYAGSSPVAAEVDAVLAGERDGQVPIEPEVLRRWHDLLVVELGRLLEAADENKELVGDIGTQAFTAAVTRVSTRTTAQLAAQDNLKQWRALASEHVGGIEPGPDYDANLRASLAQLLRTLEEKGRERIERIARAVSISTDKAISDDGLVERICDWIAREPTPATVDLNDRIRVRLTPRGQIVRDKYYSDLQHETAARFPGVTIEASTSECEDVNGCSTWTLWQFAHVFGPACSMGRDPVVEGNVITLVRSGVGDVLPSVDAAIEQARQESAGWVARVEAGDYNEPLPEPAPTVPVEIDGETFMVPRKVAGEMAKLVMRVRDLAKSMPYGVDEIVAAAAGPFERVRDVLARATVAPVTHEELASGSVSAGEIQARIEAMSTPRGAVSVLLIGPQMKLERAGRRVAAVLRPQTYTLSIHEVRAMQPDGQVADEFCLLALGVDERAPLEHAAVCAEKMGVALVAAMRGTAADVDAPHSRFDLVVFLGADGDEPQPPRWRRNRRFPEMSAALGAALDGPVPADMSQGAPAPRDEFAVAFVAADLSDAEVAQRAARAMLSGEDGARTLTAIHRSDSVRVVGERVAAAAGGDVISAEPLTAYQAIEAARQRRGATHLAVTVAVESLSEWCGPLEERFDAVVEIVRGGRGWSAVSASIADRVQVALQSVLTLPGDTVCPRVPVSSDMSERAAEPGPPAGHLTIAVVAGSPESEPAARAVAELLTIELALRVPPRPPSLVHRGDVECEVYNESAILPRGLVTRAQSRVLCEACVDDDDDGGVSLVLPVYSLGRDNDAGGLTATAGHLVDVLVVVSVGGWSRISTSRLSEEGNAWIRSVCRRVFAASTKADGTAQASSETSRGLLCATHAHTPTHTPPAADLLDDLRETLRQTRQDLAEREDEIAALVADKSTDFAGLRELLRLVLGVPEDYSLTRAARAMIEVRDRYASGVSTIDVLHDLANKAGQARKLPEMPRKIDGLEDHLRREVRSAGALQDRVRDLEGQIEQARVAARIADSIPLAEGVRALREANDVMAGAAVDLANLQDEVHRLREEVRERGLRGDTCHLLCEAVGDADTADEHVRRLIERYRSATEDDSLIISQSLVNGVLAAIGETGDAQHGVTVLLSRYFARHETVQAWLDGAALLAREGLLAPVGIDGPGVTGAAVGDPAEFFPGLAGLLRQLRHAARPTRGVTVVVERLPHNPWSTLVVAGVHVAVAFDDRDLQRIAADLRARIGAAS